jgi:RNA polymerase sigma factor (sigma-70 family)
MSKEIFPSALDDPEDVQRALSAGRGDAHALRTLIERHHHWVFNLALRVTGRSNVAEDVAQEALLRVVTRISTYQGTSSFRAWAGRIVVRCLLDSRRVRSRAEPTLTDTNIEAVELETPESEALVREARLVCTLGMLLCLDPVQRVAFVLGEVFELDSALAAELLDITPSAFRKRLQRAREDLSEFVGERCGLVRASNPCRCPKKTAVFIANGLVDPSALLFRKEAVSLHVQAAPTVLENLSSTPMTLQRDVPAVERREIVARLSELLSTPPV